MHPSDDDHLPDDLREVEDVLRSARPGLNPIEADHLQQRIARRMSTRGRSRKPRLRRNGVAVALTTGLMLTTGASAVLATGGGSYPPPTNPPDSGGCQYHPSWTKTYTFKKDAYTTITVTVSYDCKTGKFKVTITCSKPITYYYCNGKKYTVPSNTKTTTFELSPGVNNVQVTSGGVTTTFPFVLTP